MYHHGTRILTGMSNLTRNAFTWLAKIVNALNWDRERGGKNDFSLYSILIVRLITFSSYIGL